MVNKIPNRIYSGDFLDITIPTIGDNGKAAVYNYSTGKTVWAFFEPLGSVTAHVGLSNPHTQYQLISGLGTAAFLNVGVSANNIVQLNGSGFLPALNGSLLTNVPVTNPGGSNTQVQYNNSGVFAGHSGFVYDSVNGWVGIGTTPTKTLTVAQSSGFPGVVIRHSGAIANGNEAQFSLGIGQTSFGASDKTYQVKNRSFDGTTGTFVVQYWDGVGYFERLRIAPDGKVGIGITTPSQALDVVGSIKSSISLIAPAWKPAADSTTALQLQNASGTAIVTVDTANKRISINGTPSHRLSIVDEFPVSDRGLLLQQSSTGVQAPLFIFRKSRGTVASPLTVVSGDLLGWFSSQPHDGSDYLLDSCQMAYSVTGTTGVGNVQASISFIVGGLSPNYTPNLIIHHSGNVGVGLGGNVLSSVVAPTALIDIAASTTARSSLRIRSGTAPTTPNAGDIWYPTSGRLSLYRSVTETIASGVQATGGAATATMIYTATEQAMLQKTYDICRSFGMLD